MSKRRRPWGDGHRAWARLAAWHAGESDRSASGCDAALEAMTDIATLRRLLDRAELAAVRAARQQRKSWAEIATRLGVTRQSAWERWRELDDEIATSAAPFDPPADPPRAVVAEVTAEIVSELTAPQARAQRRRAKAVVPNVVGMSWDDARHTLLGAGLGLANADPDGRSLAELGWPNVVVVDQMPEAGAKVSPGQQVRLWLERGGGSAGVREPRRPSPTPKSGYEWREEPSEEAVG